MIRPSKAVIAGAAVAGLLTGSFAVRAYAASTLRILASPSKPWLMPKRVNTRAKAKTIVRAKAVARPATLVAKARTLAKAREVAPRTEANHLKRSDETAVV